MKLKTPLHLEIMMTSFPTIPFGSVNYLQQSFFLSFLPCLTLGDHRFRFFPEVLKGNLN